MDNVIEKISKQHGTKNDLENDILNKSQAVIESMNKNKLDPDKKIIINAKMKHFINELLAIAIGLASDLATQFGIIIVMICPLKLYNQ